MRFNKVTVSLVMIALALVGAFGCGGHSGSSPAASAFAGVYRSAFTRAITPDTELVIGVNGDGATSAIISDSDGILYVGSGKTREDGTFTVLATPPAKPGMTPQQIQQVRIAATIYAEGFSANLAGAMNQTVGGFQFQEPATTTPFQGTLSGQFEGDDSGSFLGSVDNHGNTIGVGHAGAVDLSLDGLIKNDGSLTLHVSGLDQGMALMGYVFLLPGKNVFSGSGTWTSKNGGRGTWKVTGNLIFH